MTLHKNLSRSEGKVEIVSLKGPEKANLKYSTLDGAFATAATKIVDSYSIPFILSLGAGKVEVALLDSMQSLGRGISQLPGVKLAEKLGSRKAVWNICSGLQRLMLIPLIFMAFSGISMIYLAIAFLALSTFFMALKTPAWASLIGDIVPDNMRGRFFARRNMLMGFTSLASILVLGSVIGSFTMAGQAMQGYGLAFAISLILGLLSVVMVYLKIEDPSYRPPYKFASHIRIDIEGTKRWLSVNRNFVYFTSFVAFMQFSVKIASPFIAVYVLNELQLGIVWLAAIIAFTSLSETLSYRHWGKALDIVGEKTVLAVTGMLVILIPFAWIFASLPAHGLMIAILDGFAWSGFDTAVFALTLSTTPKEQRLSFVAKHNTVKEFSMVLGAITAGALAHYFDSNPLLASPDMHSASLQSLFLVSFLLRAVSLALIPWIRGGNGKGKEIPFRDAFVELAARQPFEGAMETILLPVTYTRKGYEGAKTLKKRIKEMLYRMRYVRMGVY